MKKELMKILFSGRVLILISVLIMSLLAIAPNLNAEGLEINRVESDSSASVNGLELDAIDKPDICQNDYKHDDDYR